MGEKFPLVCLDRDGTIIRDDGNLYLGKTDDWREKVRFFPGVAAGIRALNRNKIGVVMITNQSGVALSGSEFDKLTEDRMHETCNYIVERLLGKGAIVARHFACPFVDSEYARKAEAKGRKVNSAYVSDGHQDLKPNTGMVEKAARFYGKSMDKCNIFVVGDRFSDVQTGLNAGGVGILIPGAKTIELGDIIKAEEAAAKNPGKVYAAENFLDACHYIARKVY